MQTSTGAFWAIVGYLSDGRLLLHGDNIQGASFATGI